MTNKSDDSQGTDIYTYREIGTTTGTGEIVTTSTTGSSSYGSPFTTIRGYPIYPYWINPYRLYEFMESNILSYEPNQSVFSVANDPKYKIMEYEP